MTSAISSLTVIQAWQYIEQMDFSTILQKMTRYDGWYRRDAQTTCQLYRNFLFLTKKYPQHHPLPPSKEIDEFWHYHILDTRRYQQDCKRLFGCYLHHYPYFGIDENTNWDDLVQAFETTQHLHKQEFGYRIPKVKSIWARILGWFP
jgi:hypothetical protein